MPVSDHIRVVALTGVAVRYPSHLFSTLRIGKNPADSAAHAFKISWIAKGAVHILLDKIRNTADLGRHDRHSSCHGLQQYHRAVLFERRHRETVSRRKPSLELVTRCDPDI